jgi:hypothetical protein
MKDLLTDETRDMSRAFLTYATALYSTGEQEQQARFLAEAYDDAEQRLWAAFLWAASYDGSFCWAVLNAFPAMPPIGALEDWYSHNLERIKFDVDFRWKKSRFPRMYREYRAVVGNDQEGALRNIGAFERFDAAWDALGSIDQFGRLSRWNYVEVLNMFGFSKLDAPDFALRKADSVRNGVAFSSNLSELVTKRGRKIGGEKLTAREFNELDENAEYLLSRVAETVPDATRLGVETAFCWFKKKACRPKNSRYFGGDEDRTYEDILFLQKRWPEVSVEPLLKARETLLPAYLLSEKRPKGAVRGKSQARMRLFYDHGIQPEEKLHLVHGQGLNEFHTEKGTEFRAYSSDELLFTINNQGYLVQ